MNDRLQDKVAIITGGAHGMGAAHVRMFVEEGAKVLLTDIQEASGAKLAQDLGANATFTRHDVTNENEWKRVVDAAESTYGPVSILVNNAGIVKNGLIAEMSEEEYRDVIDVNQTSVFLGMKSVFPSMKKSHHGSIVNISSIEGLQTVPALAAYTASKFAVRGMTKTAALEFAEYGIRVNSVHPGLIKTEMTQREEVREVVEEFLESVPMKRIAEPEEVSKLVVFLASDDSSYSTGSEYVVDGGVTQR